MMSGRWARVALWARLARRFMRTKPTRRSAGTVLVATTLLMGLFVALKGFTPSSEQVVQRDLGRFTFSTGLQKISGNDAAALDRAATAARRAGAIDAMVLLQSFNDVLPPIPDPPFTVFLEAAWPSEPFPERYSLTDGRWPRAPREVAVTDAFAGAVKGEQAFTVFSGNQRLRVVGRVRDRFGTASSKILAAPGTWRAFAAAKGMSAKYPLPAPLPILLWSGGEQNRVVRSIAGVASPGAEVESGGPATDLRTREAELSKVRRSWIDKIPLAYRIPSVGLVLLAVLGAFGMNARRLRRNLGTLRSVGIGAADATAAVILAGSAWVLVACVAGSAVGIGLGLAARAIAREFVTSPLSPFPDVSGPALRFVAVAIVACLGVAVAAMVGQRRSTARSLLSSLPRGRWVSNVRHALATLAAAVAIWQGFSLDAIDEAMILVGTLAAVFTLMTPEIVRTALRWFPVSGPRRRLARQQLLFDQGRALIVVAVLTATLGPPVAMATLLDTLITSETRVPSVAPHQVVLSGPNGGPRAQQGLVDQIVRRVDPPAPPVQLSYLGSGEDQPGPKDVDVTVAGDDLAFVMAVETVEDAVRLSNGALTDAQRQTLRNGGLLAWSQRDRKDLKPEGGALQLVVQNAQTGAALSKTAPIPAVYAPFEPSWQENGAGLILTSTARRLGLPVFRAEVVLTGVGPTASARAKQAAIDAGYDPRQVGVHDIDTVEVPPAFWAAIIGLGLLVLLTIFSLTGAQAAMLRSYLGGLIALGLPRGWARNVLNLQTGILVAISAISSLVIGVVPIVIAAVKVPGLTLAIPWSALAAIVALFAGSAALGTALSSRRLRAADRIGSPPAAV